MTRLSKDLQSFYEFIRGAGPYTLFGMGINTYPDCNEDGLHDACLELEKTGLIYRKKEYVEEGQLTSVLWMPTERIRLGKGDRITVHYNDEVIEGTIVEFNGHILTLDTTNPDEIKIKVGFHDTEEKP